MLANRAREAQNMCWLRIVTLGAARKLLPMFMIVLAGVGRPPRRGREIDDWPLQPCPDDDAARRDYLTVRALPHEIHRLLLHERFE
jgi:hypothetical protein